mgnify:CR=1 FL=1
MPTHVLNLPAGASALWQNRLGLLLESTGEGVFGIDLAGNCVFINRAGAQMLGFAADEVMGRNMHALTHHSHPDGSPYADSDCPIFNAFRQGLPCRVDTEVFWRQDGSAFAVEYSSHPILEGEQVGKAPPMVASIGCEAVIRDFVQQDNGFVALSAVIKMDAQRFTRFFYIQKTAGGGFGLRLIAHVSLPVNQISVVALSEPNPAIHSGIGR